MSSYNNSIDALRELLLFPSNLSHTSCSITRISQDISHLSNGLEYCLVEITCDSSIQYGIQAYGDEAVKLRMEAIKHQQKSLENEKVNREEKGNREQIETNLFSISS